MKHANIQKYTTNDLIKIVQKENEDFEFYPTTLEMMESIKNNMNKDELGESPSVLDCGAGDGRMLRYLTKGEKYAIEKSTPLLSTLTLDIFIVGTDFHQQTLLDKNVSVITCNPPYSEYEVWADKIIREGNATAAIYLIIPARWQRSSVIQQALDARGVNAEIIYEGDFIEAERRARAKVHIVKIKTHQEKRSLWYESRENRTDGTPIKTIKDPFDLWFEEHFKISASTDTLSEWSKKEKERKKFKEKVKSACLVEHKSLIEALVDFYDGDLKKLIRNYKLLARLDKELLDELNVQVDGVKEALREKIKGLKNLYWNELFSRLDSITSRLTNKSRSDLLRTLTKNTSIDFSVDNAHALALWVVKNANDYIDSQLVDVYESMANAANTQLYVSNKKTFSNSDWFYNRGNASQVSHYKLDHRIIVSRFGGLKTNWYSGAVGGLSDNAKGFIEDLLTIALSLGFLPADQDKVGLMVWERGGRNVFHYKDISTGETRQLFEVKAFLNGNLHVKFNQKFILALNCAFGKLKGWLHSAKEASIELSANEKLAEQYFSSTIKVDSANNDVFKISFKSTA